MKVDRWDCDACGKSLPSEGEIKVAIEECGVTGRRLDVCQACLDRVLLLFPAFKEKPLLVFPPKKRERERGVLAGAPRGIEAAKESGEASGNALAGAPVPKPAAHVDIEAVLRELGRCRHCRGAGELACTACEQTGLVKAARDALDAIASGGGVLRIPLR